MTEKDWKKATILESANMAEAIRVMDQGSLRIALVQDSAGRLKGTITDGDIRRALMSGLDQQAPVTALMNKSPTSIRGDEDRDLILDLMANKDILHLPIVDAQGRLTGLETLEHLTWASNKLPNTVFLMAGGFGKRLHPLTHDVPKPMLQVGSKPILQTILEQFVHQGFVNFVLTTHYKSEMISDHFGDGGHWGVNIEYLHESEPLGTAGGLGQLPGDHKSHPVIVMNGDLLTRLNFRHLLEFHEQSAATATMCVREHTFTIPYGVVHTDGENITGIVEKPVHRYSVNAGIYVLSPELIESIPADSCIDMTTVLQGALEQDKPVVTFPVHEYWLDIGRMEDYERANLDVHIDF